LCLYGRLKGVLIFFSKLGGGQAGDLPEIGGKIGIAVKPDLLGNNG